MKFKSPRRVKNNRLNIFCDEPPLFIFQATRHELEKYRKADLGFLNFSPSRLLEVITQSILLCRLLDLILRRL
jgi:hypothetical protein